MRYEVRTVIEAADMKEAVQRVRDISGLHPDDQSFSVTRYGLIEQTTDHMLRQIRQPPPETKEAP